MQNAGGSDGSPGARAEAAGISLEQLQALVKGGLLDELLRQSPVFGQMHERLATLETRGGQIQESLGQITAQLQQIVQTFQAAPPPGGDAPPADPAAGGQWGPWAPLISLLAQKALSGGQAAPAQDPTQLMAAINLANELRKTTVQEMAQTFKLFVSILGKGNLREVVADEGTHLAGGGG